MNDRDYSTFDPHAPIPYELTHRPPRKTPTWWDRRPGGLWGFFAGFGLGSAAIDVITALIR